MSDTRHVLPTKIFDNFSGHSPTCNPHIARLTIVVSFEPFVVVCDSPSHRARNTPLPSQKGQRKTPYIFGMFGMFTPGTEN